MHTLRHQLDEGRAGFRICRFVDSKKKKWATEREERERERERERAYFSFICSGFCTWVCIQGKAKGEEGKGKTGQVQKGTPDMPLWLLLGRLSPTSPSSLIHSFLALPVPSAAQGSEPAPFARQKASLGSKPPSQASSTSSTREQQQQQPQPLHLSRRTFHHLPCPARDCRLPI